MLHGRFDEPVHRHIWLDKRGSPDGINCQNIGESADIHLSVASNRTRTICRAMMDSKGFATLEVMGNRSSDRFHQPLVDLHDLSIAPFRIIESPFTHPIQKPLLNKLIPMPHLDGASTFIKPSPMPTISRIVRFQCRGAGKNIRPQAFR